MTFAVRVVRFCRTLPNTWEARHVGGQLLSAASSVAMNYRAAGRARSHKEFTAKLGVVVEEADETSGWLQMIVRLDLSTDDEVMALLKESNSLVAIFVAGYRTARAKHAPLGKHDER